MLHPNHIQRFRAETPGCQHRIHLNNAGAALMPKLVIDAIGQHIQLEATTGGYEAAAQAHEAIEGFYTALAILLNCSPANIAWAASATDAYNRALSAIPFEEDDVILTTNNDYVSNQLAFLELQKRYGVRLIRAADLPTGGVDVDSVQALVRQYHPRLVAVTHVPTNSGLVQPVAEIGTICAAEDVLYLVDACQSAGQLPIDVATIQCDFLSATFRKFLRGPRGAGFLYVSDKALELGLEPLFVDLHSATWLDADFYEIRSDARRFELWERPYALLLGSRACVEYALAIGISDIAQRVRQLADYCRARIATLPGARILDEGTERCGIVTAHFAHQKPGDIRQALDAAGINVTFPQQNNAVIDFDRKGVRWALRVSPHYYNTETEIERLVEVLQDGLPA